MKKYILIIMLFLLTGCTANTKETIVVSNYPNYDFVKNIVKDKMEVELLIPFGIEVHSYDPTPSDIIKVSKAKVFIYNGDTLEPWASKIINSIDHKPPIIDASKNINLYFEEDHEEHADPHIWLNPNNATTMVDNILESIIKLDPGNEEFYRKNALEYKNKLKALDEELTSIKSDKLLVFGSQFAFIYLTDYYHFNYISVYDGCGDEVEPSAKKVATVIEEIKQYNLNIIYYENLTNSKVATSIANETNSNLLLLHSIDNITKQELNDGKDYLYLMKENIKNLKKGLLYGD